MPTYENAVIYKLVHKNDQDNLNIYIGSTTNFRGRKCQHKSACNNENNDICYNLTVYKYIRNNGGWQEWEMVAVEIYPCDCKRELEIRERYHIESLKPTLNKQFPTRGMKEYYEDNREKYLEYFKEYRENNREKTKEYYEDNREKRLEYFKEYREVNKEKISEKVTCECGCEITKSNLSNHKKTQRHIKNMKLFQVTVE